MKTQYLYSFFGTEIVPIESNQYLKAMKTLAIIILGMFFYTGISAQESGTQSGESSTRKIDMIKQHEAILAQQFNETKAIISNKSFVIQADYLSNQYGYRNFVNSDLNFIMVDSTEAVIQTGRNAGIGYNGVGGITTDGNITSWKVITNEKNKTLNVEMSVFSIIGYFNVMMYVSSDGSATATLTGNYAGSLTFSGKLVPLSESYAYKGRSL